MLPRPPEKAQVHETRFKIGDLGLKPARVVLTPDAIVLARKANPDGKWDVSFSYRPTRKPALNDYYYLRVVQIDGETAWTSPIWIGEKQGSIR
jgi:hypothetical protein